MHIKNIIYKILLILKFYQAKDKDPLELALVRWYDEVGELWGCPKLKLIKQYSCIPIDSIDRTVHIVARFEKINEYLVNSFMF